LFVSLFVLIPLGASTLNHWLFFSRRPFLLRTKGQRVWGESRQLLADGIRFLGAGFSNVLIFQWPVYWVARSLPPTSSSFFAICVQATILPIGSVYGFLQPLWSSTADALARGDHGSLNGQIRRGRAVIVAIGGGAFFTMLFFGERIVHLWLRKPVTLDWLERGLMGMYILLAMWEYFHFIMALGMGRLREATKDVFQRSIGFALVVPLLTSIGGINALWAGMCCSILFWTAWRLPRLLHTDVGRTPHG
jgi:O-antigen/teichoic acid export membrane protein